MTDAQNRRRFYKYPFVNTKLQFRFAFLMAIIGLGNIIYFSILFYMFSQRTVDTVIDQVPDFVPLDSVLAKLTQSFFVTIGWIAASETILVILWGLFFTHRIAGPIFAIGKRMEAIADHEIPEPVQLRSGDMLNEFADQCNRAMSALNHQRNELRSTYDELKNGNAKNAQDRLKRMLVPEQSPGSPSTDGVPQTN
jgi:methyl-accepting chemotaxis protein